MSKLLQIQRYTPLALALAASACDPADRVEVHASAPAVSQESPAFDVDTLVEHARLAYAADKNDPQTMLGGHDTFAVRAARGVVSISPRHYPSGEEASRIEGAPLSIETIGIGRGAARELPEAKLALRDDGTLAIDHGVAEEVLQNTPSGVEQSWHFQTPPPGKGALEIRARVSGETYAGWSEEGHHFLDEKSNLGIRYGAATWIDAAGLMANIPVRYLDGALELTVAEEILEASEFPAVLDPTLYPEVSLANPAIGPSAYRAEVPAVAFDGTNYFAVWADQRRGTRDIFGARIRPSDGAVLDGVGLELRSGNYEETSPAIAWNGTRFVLVWQDQRSGDFDLYGMLLNSDGTAASAELPIAVGLPGAQQNAVVAASGSTAVVAWQDARNGTDNVYYARIDSTGLVLGTPGGDAVGAGTVPQGFPGIGCGAAQCLLAWQNGNAGAEDIQARRIASADGSLPDAAPITVATVAGRDLSPAVGFDGTNYLLAWRSQTDIRANRVAAADGSVLNGNTGFLISNAANQQQRPAIGFSGSEYFVVWHDARTDSVTWDIYGARVTTAGVVRDVTGSAISTAAGSQMFPRIAFGAGRYFAVWQDSRGSTNAVYGARIFTTGAVFDSRGIAISLGAARQFASSAAFDGFRYFVVYADNHGQGGGNYDIRGIRVSRAGVLLDPTGISISSAAGNQTSPDVAWNGTEFLVVWRDQRSGTGSDIYGTRLNGGYIVQEPSGLPICTHSGDQLHPVVAYNTSVKQFLVVWDDGRNGAALDIFGARVADDGTVLDGPDGFAISTAEGLQERPDVASNNALWLVAWTDSRPSAVGIADIYGNSVAADGTVPGFGADIPISTAPDRQGGVRLAYNGVSDFLATWGDDRNGIDTDVYGARIAAATLTVRDPLGIPLAATALGESRAAPVVMGSTYFIVWQQTTAVGSVAVDLYGRQFNFDGTPADVLGPSLIAGAPEDEQQPAVAVHNATNALVAYQRFEGAGFLSERLHARRVQFP